MDCYLVQCMGPQRDRWTGPLPARTSAAAARRGVKEIRREMAIQEVRVFRVTPTEDSREDADGAALGDWFDADALFDDPPADPEGEFRERQQRRSDRRDEDDRRAEERRLGYR